MPELQFDIRRRILSKLNTPTETMPNADNNKDSSLDFDTDDFVFVST